MEEVIVQESVPSLIPAVAVYIHSPKHAQTFMQAANTLYPFDNHEEHLKRFCKTPGDSVRSGPDNGSAETTKVSGALKMIVHTGCPCQREAVRRTQEGRSAHIAVCHGCEAVQLATRYDTFTQTVIRMLHLCESEVKSFSVSLGFHLVHVPDRAPRRSTELWTRWNSVWPLASPKPRPTEPLSGGFVEQANAIMIDHIVPMCVSELMRAYSHDDMSRIALRTRPARRDATESGRAVGHGLRSCAATPVPIAAAIVDSRTHEMLVTSEDCHYLCDSSNYSAYVPYFSMHPCGDDVCRTGASAPLEGGGSHSARARCPVRRVGDCCAHHRPYSALPVCGGGSVTTEHPVIFVLKKLSRLLQGEHASSIDRGVSTRASSVDGRGKRDVDKSQPYLATHMDLYVSHEPCIMCAMALVHSRIRHVYFCYRNAQHGGLGSVFAVHTIPSLNHHYRAFRCIVAADTLERSLTDAKLAYLSTRDEDSDDAGCDVQLSKHDGP